MLDVGRRRHLGSLRVARLKVRRDLLSKAVDELAEVLVELNSLLQPETHFAVRLRRLPESSDKILLIAFGLGPTSLHLARLLAFADGLEIGADLCERRLLVVKGGGDASLVSAELFEFGGEEGGLDAGAAFAVEDEEV